MADDPAHRGGLHPPRIDIAKDQDLRHWSRAFDIPADELVRAVAQLGDDPRRIEQHLHRRDGERKGGGAGPDTGRDTAPATGPEGP